MIPLPTRSHTGLNCGGGGGVKVAGSTGVLAATIAGNASAMTEAATTKRDAEAWVRRMSRFLQDGPVSPVATRGRAAERPEGDAARQCFPSS